MSTSVEIEKLIYGGDGLVRLPSGEVVFVPWGAPGDEIELTVFEDSKPKKGRIEKLIKPSSLRQEAPCTIFGLCGGCQWQHITPSAQREWKRQIVSESLTRLGKLPDISVLPTLGNDDSAWHYRNRVQWEIDTDADALDGEDYQLGYHQAQSHQLITFEHCWIIPEALNQLANWIQDYVRQHPKVASHLLRLEASLNEKGQILLTLEGEKGPAMAEFTQAIQPHFPALLGIVQLDRSKNRVKKKTLWGQDHLIHTLGSKQFQVSAGSFFQVNPNAAESLLKLLEQWLLPEAQSVVDIYAGVGTFALHVANKIPVVLALESSPIAVADASASMVLNNCLNMQVMQGDVKQLLPNLKNDFDVAIIDPPRSGCQKEVLDWINTHVQKQVLYVSCNPTTLARDVRILVDQGWRIETVQPIDMFPQTYHVETLVDLRKP